MTYLQSTDDDADAALAPLSRALDDLRMLGEIDLRLNYAGE